MFSQETVQMTIKNKYLKTYINQYPLISKEALVGSGKIAEEGSLIELFTEKGRFIGKGYYGKQNKGFGWIISRDRQCKINDSFFENLLRQALKIRKSFYNNPDTTAFRIFNGEGDGFGGFTIDYFDGFYLITWYNKGVYLWKDMIVRSLESLVSVRGIYEKKRFSKEGKYVDAKDYVKGEKAPEPLIVLENKVKFAIYLDDGPMVGVFLDQREVRKAIRDVYAKGRSVLNTFSYTGAFSVFAALGGASKTTSVDLANRSRPKTEEHFFINGIAPDSQDIIVEDVFNYFKYAVRKQLCFDMVILDPPSFARSKKRTFSVAKDYVDLLKDAIQITAKGGMIVASTNYSNFDMKKFKTFIDIAFKELNARYKVKETYTLPEDFHISTDFPEGDYLKVIFIEKTS